MNIKNKTLLITGIGGFIGLRTAELALAQGMKVRGLQHSVDKAKKAEKLGAQVILGSVTDPVICQKACQGVDIVLHTVSVGKEGGSLDHFREVNVGGTINMAKTAREAGVKSFVYLSSVMVYGFNYRDRITEEGPLCGENNVYCQTKIEAEEALLQLNAPPDFGIINIRPGDVYGPGSITWIVRPLLLMRQRLFALANGGQGVMNHVYLDNLIEGIFLAIEKEAYGEAFNITDGQETSWKEYFMRLAEIGGVPKPISLPASVLQSLLWQQKLANKILGKKTDILPDSLGFVTRPYAYSIAKAQSRLTYQPKIDLQEGMRRTQEWLQKTDIQELIQP
ncbi:NAD-dependent epimerase/dehydratase family protein [aff. Roholtiella sp. LEGE 12411]|uniref:NAD-dependent epimerase/dehydratase family protein n=1 Tax=aff. Roholtiella sp. LEGE 12411 TaxID=1828822 RepID=UPI0018811A52|nr:NAD-dependent epimerase/dehydratase family protein [aff. Roholtiella sp. LEGE 12411]MBE9038617.1 NAD-dependent epimerase/dehydratase family protein [aff. Roholtiella sp. LEGE 12411]